MNAASYPDAVDPNLVETYPPLSKAGGGYVWDDVLEYRVWCHPERGAPDIEDGNDYYYAFAFTGNLVLPKWLLMRLGHRHAVIVKMRGAYSYIVTDFKLRLVSA